MSSHPVVAAITALTPIVGHGVTAWNSLLAHRAEIRRIRVDMEQIRQQARLGHHALNAHHAQTMRRLAQEYEQCMRAMEYAFAQLQGKLMDREAIHANMANYRTLISAPTSPPQLVQSAMMMLSEQTQVMTCLWEHEAVAFTRLAAVLEQRSPLPQLPSMPAQLLER